MRGIVLGYNEASGEGVATAKDGERFSFSRSDWKSPTLPRVGLGVDFSAQEGKAFEIYALPEGSDNGTGMTVRSDQAQQAFRLGGVSLACGVIGIFVPFLGLLLAVFALVTGVKAFKKGRQYNDQAGQIMGLIGSIIGGLTLAAYTVSLLFMITVGTGLGFLMMGM
jgi:hypothetical protein